MNIRKILFGTGLALAMTLVTGIEGFPQASPGASRISQPIIINGQPANGAYVRSAAGNIQSFQCPDPQPYTTPGGSSSGWACFEPSTGVYILNALPPAQPPAQPQAPAPLPQAQVPPPPQAQAPAQPAPLPYEVPNPAVAYGRYPGRGHVKIETNIKTGSIYVDGGFVAAVRGKDKKLTLSAGNHDIEVHDASDRTVLKERVQVLPGKTVELKTN